MQLLKAKDLKPTEATVLIYAPPKHGKTTLLGMLPGKTLIVDVDRGTQVLAGRDVNVDIVRLSEDLSDLPEILRELETKCPYNNVCVDSLSELEKAMLTVLGRKGKNNGAPELAHYNQVQFKIADYCRRFRALPANVIFTAWEQKVEHISLGGEKYTQAVPMLSGKSTDVVCGLCDVVGRIIISSKQETEGQRFVVLRGSQSMIAADRMRNREYCKFEEVI